MKLEGMTIKVGADPEFFLKSKSTGSLVSAHDIIPGTKSKPYPVANGAVQVDGVLAEININPAETEEEFVSNTLSVISTLKSMLPQDIDIVMSPTGTFDKGYWKDLPKSVKELGCVPDMNAYTGLPNPVPEDVEAFRVAAGHIHIGWHDEDQDVNDPDHIEACIILAKELDHELAPILTLLGDEKEERSRRTMYGSTGSFRVKPYGMEYRVPSNYWCTDPRLMRLVFRQVHEVFRRLLSGEFENQKGEFNLDTYIQSMDVEDYLNSLSKRYPKEKDFSELLQNYKERASKIEETMTAKILNMFDEVCKSGDIQESTIEDINNTYNSFTLKLSY